MERWDTLWPGGWTFCFGDGAFKPSTDSFLLGGFPPLRSRYDAASHSWAMVHVSSDRASPRLPAAALPPPAGK